MAQSYPRGSAGCVLYPGTTVRINGLKSTLGRTQNGLEGVCLWWDAEKGQMHIEMPNKDVKIFSPKNLQKVQKEGDEEEVAPEAIKIMQVFQAFDTNGDGVLDGSEFTNVMISLGLPAHVVPKFLKSIDKDGDDTVSYEEFVKWVMKKDKTGKTKAETMWPPKPNYDKEPDPDPEQQDKKRRSVAALPWEDDADVEMSREELEAAIGGKKLPRDWPEHGMTVFNNMHNRFPDFPIDGIVFQMRQNNYIGGQVAFEIRQTGAREVEHLGTSSQKVGPPEAFPAMYKNRCGRFGGCLRAYAQNDPNFTFQNMRDDKLKHAQEIEPYKQFEIREVRKGGEYGFAFGRISSGSNPLWVVLGIPMSAGTISLSEDYATDLSYTNAERVVKFKLEKRRY